MKYVMFQDERNGYKYPVIFPDNVTHSQEDYLKYVDELPHHFQLHFMHAAEILGYKHPDDVVRRFWNTTYNMIVNDAHLLPESEATMDRRLGDSEKQWREAEVVTAAPPKPPWMDKIYKDENYITIDEWHIQFEIRVYRKYTPYTYDGITGFKSMQDALAEVNRRWKTVRIISSSDLHMELGVS